MGGMKGPNVQRKLDQSIEAIFGSVNHGATDDVGIRMALMCFADLLAPVWRGNAMVFRPRHDFPSSLAGCLRSKIKHRSSGQRQVTDREKRWWQRMG